MRFHRWLLVLAPIAAFTACGGGMNDDLDGGGMDAARPDASSVDAAQESDGASGSDAGTRDAAASDAASASDAAVDAGAADGGVDACATPECPAPPPGCSYAGGDECTCGTLECSDAGCIAPPCVPPPPGCSYVGGDACTCGTLVCASDCGGSTCAPTQYCDYAMPNGCSGAGTCRARPELCPDNYDPVCGCDGRTYSNTCHANSSGVDVASEGECTSDCRSAGCPSGSTCQPCRGAGWVCLDAGTVC